MTLSAQQMSRQVPGCTVIVANSTQQMSRQVLSSWAAANRHRDATLKVDKHLCPQHNNYVMDTYKFPAGAGDWQLIKLDPAGLLSFCLWTRDPLYKAGEGLLRRQLQNEGYIELRDSFERACAARKRRRMVELFENGLGTNRDGLSVEPADLAAFWETWAVVMACQFVRISSRSEGGNSISFVPADLRRWTADRPVHYVDEGCETIFLEPTDGVGQRILSQYVSDREADGWHVSWPTADGTKEELERRLIPLLNVVSVSEKAKKAEIAAVLGRHDGLEALISFSAATPKSFADDY